MELGFERTDCDTFLSFLFIKRSWAYSNTSFLFRSIHPFFLFSFHSLGRSLISAIWQVMPIVDPRNKSLNVRFLLWINKKNLISNRRICYKNLAMFAITRSYVVHEIFVYILTRNIMVTKKKMGKKCDEESMNGLLNWNKNSHNLFNNNWFTRNSVNISKY